MSITDADRDDTFDEMEILLGRLLSEAYQANRYLRFFYIVLIIVLVLNAVGAGLAFIAFVAATS
jgi:hypothetical protein